MNSLSGGASIPNAARSPNSAPPSPTPPARGPHAWPGRAHCGCGRHVNRRAEPRGRKRDPTRSPAPALRSPPRGPEAAGRLGALTALTAASGGAGPRPCPGPASERDSGRTATPASGASPRPPRTGSPTRRSPNFLLALHFPHQSSGPRWGWRKKGWRKEKQRF
nr:serine/arginine repetitive matrix protein 3-like [Equus asinus]